MNSMPTTVYYDPPAKPGWQLQNPPGWALGGKSCTCFAGTICTLRNTFGKRLLPGKRIRTATHDTSGGTTIDQVADAIFALTGEDDLDVGYRHFHKDDPDLSAEGRGMLVAIRYREVLKFHRAQLRAGVHQKDLIGGIEQGFGESPDDWHAETWHRWLQPGESATIDGKKLTAPPNQRGRIVHDPLCDGRRSTVAEGWVVYPESLIDKIVADSSIYMGKMYVAVTLDGRYEVADPPPPKPPVQLKYGAHRIPRRKLTATKPGWKRSSPRRSISDPTSNRLRHLAVGQRFIAFQVTRDGTKIGDGPDASKWYGNRQGTVWVHSSRFRKGKA